MSNSTYCIFRDKCSGPFFPASWCHWRKKNWKGWDSTRTLSECWWSFRHWLGMQTVVNKVATLSITGNAHL